MNLILLLVAILATCMVVYLDQQGKLPAPFGWALYAFLIIVWCVVLLQATGVGSHLYLGGRVG